MAGSEPPGNQDLECNILVLRSKDSSHEPADTVIKEYTDYTLTSGIMRGYLSFKRQCKQFYDCLKGFFYFSLLLLGTEFVQSPECCSCLPLFPGFSKS